MKFEFKKYFYNKYILFFLLITIVVNFVYVIPEFSIVERSSIQTETEYMFFYPEVKGSKTEEKIRYIQKKQAEMEELYRKNVISTKNQKGEKMYTFACKNTLKNVLLPDLEYCYLYYSKNQDLVNTAKEKLDKISDENSFQIKYLNLMIRQFEDRNIPNFGLTRGYELLFSYNLSVLFCLFLLVVPISQIFAKEKEQEYDVFILSSIDRMRWSISKIKTVIFSATLFVGILYIVDIMGFYKVWNMDYPLNPIYSLKSFVYTGFNMPIILYMLFNFFIKLVAVLFMSYLFVYHSIGSKNVLTALMKNIISIIGLIFINDLLDIRFLPFNLLTNQKILTNFNVTNVFGSAIESYQVNLTMSILLVVLIRTLVYRRIRKW